jgi:DNA (cytosine-5)-methyltransferase 1
MSTDAFSRCRRYRTWLKTISERWRLKLRFIDLFAGIGGIRLGFQHIGWQCVFSSEIDEPARKTYAANFGEPPSGDITKIDPNNFDELPEFDALVGGFPCQPFSAAGLYWTGTKGFQDATRGTLFFNIADIIAKRKPKVVFLENVPNIVRHDGGKTMEIIERTFRDLGYRMNWKILNSKDFGVPQSRSRVYFVAFKSDESLDELNSIVPDHDFVFPKPTGIPTRVGDILETVVDKKYTISDNLWKGHQGRKERNKANGKGFGYSLFNADSPYTNTITARYYKDGVEILIDQPDKNPRKVTPREASYLQGFPKDFKIVVSDNQAYKQFGNSVAVPVIKAIAEQIKKQLEKQEQIVHTEASISE